MIVSGGENVYPGEVEDRLARHAAIEEAAVIGTADEEFGQVLKAFVVRAERAGQLSADEVKAYARDNLARFKVPKDVVFVTALPRNATGKGAEASAGRGGADGRRALALASALLGGRLACGGAPRRPLLRGRLGLRTRGKGDGLLTLGEGPLGAEEGQRDHVDELGRELADLALGAVQELPRNQLVRPSQDGERGAARHLVGGFGATRVDEEGEAAQRRVAAGAGRAAGAEGLDQADAGGLGMGLEVAEEGGDAVADLVGPAAPDGHVAVVGLADEGDLDRLGEGGDVDVVSREKRLLEVLVVLVERLARQPGMSDHVGEPGLEVAVLGDRSDNPVEYARALGLSDELARELVPSGRELARAARRSPFFARHSRRQDRPIL